MRLIEHWGSRAPRIIGRVKVVGLRESEFIFVSIFTEIKPMITLIIMPSIVPDKCRNFISTGSSSSMMKIKKKLFSVGDQITNYLVYSPLSYNCLEDLYRECVERSYYCSKHQTI